MTTSQTEFTLSLLDPKRPVPEGLSDGAAHPAGRRFNVYRNNVAVSLTEALETGFPVITRLLGAENMKGLAGLFLRAHPPKSPLMMHYGDAFPDFLAGLEQLSHLGYLADVARLELALRRSYHAADATPVDPDALGALSPEELINCQVELAPSVELLCSDWPVHAIWLFNRQDGVPKPQPGGQDVLITRAEFDPEPQLLPPGGATWISALSRGATIGEALDAALEHTPDFDMGVPLTLLLQGKALVSLTKKD
ncbi:HvfC/BufC N-terminal domain-containing protein [Arenibacterium sp. CAU 1754]